MRIKLKDRKLPDYTRGEETFNMVSHIAGVAFAILALVLCVVKAALQGNAWGVVGSAVYGACMIILYCMSSIYHGLKPSLGKKVFQILDHCAIYFMIAGTYTPIALCAICPLYPAIGWVIFGLEWFGTALAVTLTAIDLKRYNLFSMVSYIVMGWCVLAVLPQTIKAITLPGFWLLLSGGLCYTLGAILFAIGTKKRYFHSAFHVFVLLGSILQFLSIYLYVL